jgi:L-threonylcarbamoyladenylate synthase
LHRTGIGGGAGVWGKVLAYLFCGAGMALNSGPELHSRWRAPQMAALLWAGGVVACPAEGLWGLSCDPFDQVAVLDLLAMKQREVSKGLIVVGASSDVFADVLRDLSSEQREMMLASWPGPNTWLVPHRGYFPSWVTGESEEVAIRVTSSPALAALCKAFDGLLVSTSANPAGLPPPHSVWGLRRYFGTTLPAFPGAIDPAGKPSTIRRVEDGSVIRGEIENKE